MDLLSLLGIIFGLVAILGGNALEGGHLDSLVQPTAFLIVLGGSFGAILLQTPMPVFRRSVRMLSWIVFPPVANDEKVRKRILMWANIARREGLLGLETMVQGERDGFMQRGLQLLVDGTEPESIRDILEIDKGEKEAAALEASKVYESLGGYSPTIGIIGAVMGLIHVMENLGDPSKLGAGIAVAFVATIYGVGMANLLFLPVANKLRSLVMFQSRVRDMATEGLVAISEGENPRNVDLRMQAFAPE